MDNQTSYPPNICPTSVEKMYTILFPRVQTLSKKLFPEGPQIDTGKRYNT